LPEAQPAQGQQGEAQQQEGHAGDQGGGPRVVRVHVRVVYLAQ
jgi:hypothetical protein